MITILEYIHNKHIVHRDIKPDNFVMGLNNLSKILYLLDFGLAKKYRSSVTFVQFPLINKNKLIGTPRYASINALRGFEQSRRDDLESVGYVLMYFLRGGLPWQGMHGKNKEDRYKNILQKKIDTSPYDLCKGFPQEFAKYIEYTRNMEYIEQPKYNTLREYFINIIQRTNEEFDYIYDWSTEEETKLRRKEYLEEIKTKKNIKNNSSTERMHISSIKNGKETKCGPAESIDKEEVKEKNSVNNRNKYLDKEILYRSKTKELKDNNKYATKESSVKGNNNNNINTNNNFERFNTNYITERRNNRHKNTNHNKRKNQRESENKEHKKSKDNEEICCTEACIIF